MGSKPARAQGAPMVTWDERFREGDYPRDPDPPPVLRPYVGAFPDGRALDRLADLKAALKPGGILFYQHHLRSAEPADVGPTSDRYRFASNELLCACLDLTVLYYEERTEDPDGRTAANAAIVARNSSGGRQAYPRRSAVSPSEG